MVNDDDDVIRRERAAGVQRHLIASRNSTRFCVSCRIFLFQFFVLFFLHPPKCFNEFLFD
jgi:hypothetical protein